MIGIQKIQSVMLEHQPNILGSSSARRAAVALIVNASRSDQDPEIVFIERAHHVADPWSGQMAFPGGRCEPNDMHLAETARRETLEEIGIDLAMAQRLGRLDDLQGRHGGRSIEMLISCFVFGVNDIDQFVPNHEVADVVKLPISTLLDPENRTEVPWPVQMGKVFPGIRIDDGERIIWGLTHRFLLQFFRILGQSPPLY
jgi:8-oxo-dGTP pyrophosphatase MutT (NUDIX family)